MKLQMNLVFVVTMTVVSGAIFEIIVDPLPRLNIDEDVVKAKGDNHGPPPFTEHERMARYIVHNSEWTSMATISSRTPTVSYPFANVFSVSDGANVTLSSGIPYFYFSSLEISIHDLKVDNRASITMSLAQGNYCKDNNYDPEDPRCAHVILTGKILKVESESEEEKFAKEALWSRHPIMPSWPQDHGWFFAKLEIENILLLDFFGGAQTVVPDLYYKATPY